MKLSDNQRIALNILATYGRSVLALFCGLLTSRWILNSLGQSDYGLYGVVGALTMIASFFNWILVGAIARFYGVCIGKQKRCLEEGKEECCQWFNTALLIHVVIPFVAFAVLYPLGVYAVRNWLVIPADRINACVWVFRFSCLTCIIAMLSAPFRAMYIAKQYIAELTAYEVLSTLLNFFFILYMSTQSGIWLTTFAAWACFISVMPNVLISIRARMIFDECRYKGAYLLSRVRFVALGNFVGWQAFAGVGTILKTQGLSILVNRYFGPIGNASQSVANSVATKTDSFAGGMAAAFAPAITSAYGSGDLNRMRILAYIVCKYGTMMILVFVLPISLELPAILRLWLKNPPEAAYGLTLCIMAGLLIDRLSSGQKLAVAARGKIAQYEFISGIAIVATLPIALVLVMIFKSIYWVGAATVFSMAMLAIIRIWLARDLVGMSSRYWVRRILFPIVWSIILSVGVGILPVYYFPPSRFRLLLTLPLTEFVLVVVSWVIVFTKDEREDVLFRAKRKIGSVLKRVQR